MKNKFLFILLLFSLAALIVNCSGKNTTGAADAGKIKGTVYDALNGIPIGKALVITMPPTSAVTTDTTGLYQITNVEAGTYHVRAMKVGYDSAGVDIYVSKGNTTTADISLLGNSL